MTEEDPQWVESVRGGSGAVIDPGRPLVLSRLEGMQRIGTAHKVKLVNSMCLPERTATASRTWRRTSAVSCVGRRRSSLSCGISRAAQGLNRWVPSESVCVPQFVRERRKRPGVPEPE